MAVWSCLRSIKKLNSFANTLVSFRDVSKTKAFNYVQVRGCHRQIEIRPSRYPLKKNKDLIILYLFIGGLPIAALCTYVNLFIGPAELALIPEGYEPKHWEYYRHPITRFIARYLKVSPQERYERDMHNIFKKHEISQISRLKIQIRELMRERLDYQGWYFDKPITKHARKLREDVEEREKKKSTWNSYIVD